MVSVVATPSIGNPTSSVTPARLLTFMTDVLVLFLLIGGAFEFFGDILGIHNLVAESIFTFLWLRGAVAKLSELRRGQWLPWRTDSADHVETMVLMVVGTSPWLISQALQNGTPSWHAWQLATLPMWVRICGACVAVALFAASRAAADVMPIRPCRLLERVSPISCLLVAFLLVVSSSAFVGILAAGQLIALSTYRMRSRESRRTDSVILTLESVVVPG